MLEKMGDAPLGGLLRFGPSNPAQKFFDTVGLGGSETLLDEFQESILLVLRAFFYCLASSFLTSSTALVKSWTTWNQSTVTEADLNFCSTAERNAGDMSQTTSTMFSGRP